MYELNEKNSYKINDEMMDTMNFIFLSNTWCKFVLNIYDAGGLSAHMRPSATVRCVVRMAGTRARRPAASSLSVLSREAACKIYRTAAARQDLKTRAQLPATVTEDSR